MSSDKVISDVEVQEAREGSSHSGVKKILGWRPYSQRDGSSETAAKERRLTWKIDATLVLFGFLGTFTKFIDKANLQTAYVSGMEEDLGFYGDQMNYATTAYNIGLIVALWPASWILVRTPPRYYISAIQLGWSICTFAQSRMNTSTQMYALRALVGIFETGHFSGFMYLCGSWYRSEDLATRLAVIDISSQVGPMIGSYLQAAAYTNLNGNDGLAGWRWLMIIDGILSLCICLPQFFILPDVPARLKPNWMFSESEVALAKEIHPEEGKKDKHASVTFAQVKSWFISPEIWLLWIISICNMIGMQPSLSLNYWFKGWNTVHPGSFTVAQINDYTTPMYAIILVLTLAMGWISDKYLGARRWPMMVLGCSVNFIVCILLAATPVYPKHRAFRWFLYYNSGWGEASSVMFWAWTSEILAGEPMTRSFVMAGLNVWADIFAATVPLAVFKTVDQPAVVSGNYTAAGFLLGQVAASLGLAALIRWKDQRKQRHIAEDNSSEEEPKI